MQLAIQDRQGPLGACLSRREDGFECFDARGRLRRKAATQFAWIHMDSFGCRSTPT